MVFKRRDRRPIWKAVLEAFWPKGGWGRAALYVRHRLHRLPDPPHTIARGIFAGVFTTFTPFYGLHFIIAGLLALVMRGNVLAAMLATFFGNPLTYVPIGVIAMQSGYWLLGLDGGDNPRFHHGLGEKFVKAGQDLWHNVRALFTDDVAHWSELRVFYDEVFFPYLIGGIIPGLIAGIACYYISLPLISAYQNRRKGLLKQKLAALKKKKADTRSGAE
ncbi:DUF2062 domain-containing protein [Thalassococcus sp. CAU 1522]|uniref:DUF2062 domain-containing protein n=1 Tax=Thalassococcus arenae TaxID=2851652 RepID=A0ABS6N4H6_9RHOB|nr:DUF2062 domain-containing protein [Thalassococcus arenae]MBV2358919.1 DUF2062 domain-containing protein [Thalassococcus arenae]